VEGRKTFRERKHKVANVLVEEAFSLFLRRRILLLPFSFSSCVSEMEMGYSGVPESPLSPLSPLEETDFTKISSILL
jgi:hypothetical protein